MFKGKTLAISGGLGDIGRATAKAFATAGANIAIGDIQEAALAEAFVQELRNLQVQVLYSQVDVADASAVESWIDSAEAALGPVQLAVANAATVTIAGIFDITPAQWTQELRVNLDGAFFLSRAVSRRLRDSGTPGAVVFVGSWAAEAVHPSIPAYTVSKAGMRMLCKSLALELAPHGIMVNEIAPGYVDAGLSRKVWEQAPEQREAAKAKTPVRQLITPADIAREILRLCDPQNRHITGSTLLMDGGLSLLR